MFFGTVKFQPPNWHECIQWKMIFEQVIFFLYSINFTYYFKWISVQLQQWTLCIVATAYSRVCVPIEKPIVAYRAGNKIRNCYINVMQAPASATRTHTADYCVTCNEEISTSRMMMMMCVRALLWFVLYNWNGCSYSAVLPCRAVDK